MNDRSVAPAEFHVNEVNPRKLVMHDMAVDGEIGGPAVETTDTKPMVLMEDKEESGLESASIISFEGDEPTEEERETLRKVADKLPWSAFLVAMVELCERFTYYGLSGPFQNYIQNSYHDPSGLPGAIDAAKPSYQEEYGRKHKTPWNDLFVDELKRGLIACRVFVFYPIYWVVYSQMLNNFVSQAGTMELHGIPNDIMSNVDPLTIIFFIPIMDRMVYPLLRKFGIPFRPITRITMGFVFAAISMAYAAIVQHLIYRAGPCYDAPLKCPAANGSIPNQVHVAVQTPAYFFIGLSEIFASITGLEYAFTKAPPSMKSFVMSIFLLQSAFGSALGIALAPTAEDPKLVWMYAGLCVATIITGGIFWVIFRKYNATEEQLNALEDKGEKAVKGSGYGNWTDQGWNLRFHGNVFKQPNISESKLDDLANGFLIGTSVQSLPASQASQARNLTAEIYVLQQSNQNVTFNIAPAPTAGASGEQGGGGAVTPSGGNQQIKFPTPTTEEGDFDGFVQINDNGLQPGNTTNEIQRMNVYTEGDINGNATSYLVPDTGFTVISDIDDILRITQIYEPKEGLLNSFARPFVPWMNMPDIYANWSRSIPNLHFHYLTTTPEQITRNYMDFIYKTYPGGSFDDRPLNFSDVSATLSIRKFLLDKIFQTYPHRKFVLVADTSNSDVMRDYPQMVTDYPGQVQCILLRNTTNTDPGDRFPYNTAGFKGVDSKLYMFFVVPCVNSTIVQNITYGEQGLPFGTNLGNGKKSAGNRNSLSCLYLFVAAMGAMMWVLGL
ncbi:hypothetical protein P7C71_g3887, partial [Lecanoromycetidae sp. Uapishka_2]